MPNWPPASAARPLAELLLQAQHWRSATSSQAALARCQATPALPRRCSASRRRRWQPCRPHRGIRHSGLTQATTGVSSSPAFGQADLTNCERELIHLAGSIQPHGAAAGGARTGLRIVQASANCRRAAAACRSDGAAEPALAELGGDLEAALRRLAAAATCAEPAAAALPAAERRRQRPRVRRRGAPRRRATCWWSNSSRSARRRARRRDGRPRQPRRCCELLGAAVQRFSAASSIGTLADAVVQCFRDLTGYDRVMVYKFDPDGHGKIIAEARDPRLESLLGHHYPATDIPQRARELYLRNRVRVLVDVHYEPRRWCRACCRGTRRAELDMSMCHLRSMSPLHLQYLQQHGRHRHAGGFAGARGPAVGADRLPPLRAAQPALRRARRRRPAGRGDRPRASPRSRTTPTRRWRSRCGGSSSG